jgi:thiol-disulfide isomerase/thioredoxin
MNLRVNWAAALVYLLLAAIATTAQEKKADSFKNSVRIQFDVLHLRNGLPVLSGQSVAAVGTNLEVAISPPTINAKSRWLPDNAIEVTLEITENSIVRTETIRLEDFAPKTLVLGEDSALGLRKILRLIPVIADQGIKKAAAFVGQSLPAVSVKATDNREVSLQSFRGKPLLLDFWATWCSSCRDSIPDLQKLYAENKDKGLVLVSIDQDDEVQKAAQFWSEQKLPWPNYHLDPALDNKLPGHGLPFFVLVDSSGKVIYSCEGFDHDGLQQAINSALDSATIH